MFMTIPTLMTWTRIFAIPLIVGIFYLPDTMASQAEKNLIATVMFVLRRLLESGRPGQQGLQVDTAARAGQQAHLGTGFAQCGGAFRSQDITPGQGVRLA